MIPYVCLFVPILYLHAISWGRPRLSQSSTLQPLHVIYASDRPDCALWGSMHTLANNTQHPISFHIVVPDGYAGQLPAAPARCAVSQHRLPPMDFEMRPKQAHLNKRIAWARFFVPDFLPPDVRRAVYLDTDTLVTGDIAELFETQLQGRSMAAVSQGDSLQTWLGIKIPGVGPEHRMRNSGVLLIDVQLWRLTSITKWLLDTAHTLRFNNDQTVINVYFARHNVTDLESRWNEFNLGYDYRSKDRHVLDSEGILHWSGPRKWWKPNGVFRTDILRMMDAFPRDSSCESL